MYDVQIGRGNDLNNKIFDYLKPRIFGKWLDIGCNIGTLLIEVPRGRGVDASQQMVDIARYKGLDVLCADATKLPFADKEFDLAVLSCTLEQIPDWETALKEAIRVSDRVIGINPLVGSEWGRIGGWVQSIIDPILLRDKYGAQIVYPDISGKYYFEIISSIDDSASK